MLSRKDMCLINASLKHMLTDMQPGLVTNPSLLFFDGFQADRMQHYIGLTEIVKARPEAQCFQC